MPYADPSSPTSPLSTSSSALSSPLAGRSRRSSGASTIGGGNISPVLHIAPLPSMMASTSTKGFGPQSPQSPTRSRSGSSSSSGTIGGDGFALRSTKAMQSINAEGSSSVNASSSSSRTPSPFPSRLGPEPLPLAVAGLPHRSEPTNTTHQPSFHPVTLVHSHAPPSSADDTHSQNVATWAEQAAQQIGALVNGGHNAPVGELERDESSGAESGTSSTAASSNSSTATSPRQTLLSSASESLSTPGTSTETTPTGSIMLPKQADHSTSRHHNAVASSSHTHRQHRSGESSGSSTPHRMRSPPHSRTTSPTVSRHYPTSFSSGSAAAGFFVAPGTPGSEHGEVGDGVGVGMGGRGALPGLPRRSSSAVGGLNRMGRVEGLPISSGSWTGSQSSGSSSPANPASQAGAPLKDAGLGISLGPLAHDSQSRENRESISSISTMESNGPQTPVDADELANGLKALDIKQQQHMHAHRRPGTSLHTSHLHHGSEKHGHHRSPGHLTPNSSSESDKTMRQAALKETEEENKVITPDSAEVSVIPFPTSVSSSSPEVAHAALGSPPTPASLANIFTSTPRAPVVNPRHPPRCGSSVGLRRQPSSSLQLEIPSASATHSHWHSHGHESAHHTYRPSSIRKKSGEIVKPSLKQRSLSTPHLPIRNDYGATKSEPATPSVEGSEFSERSKNVRFAGQDDDKSQLEYVRHFQRGSKVTAVSREGDTDGAYTETETENDTDGSYVSFRTSRNAAAAAVDDAEKVIFAAFSTSLPRIRLDFAPYRSEEDKLKLANENVVLERLDLPTEGTTLVLRGSVLVRNVAFQKWVAVRFTLDHWQTVSEVSATHVTHIPPQTTRDNEGWDRFSFNIKLDDVKRTIQDKELLLCVRFSVEGREWWDSNNGHNYRFGFKKIKPVRPSRMSGISRRQVETPDSPELPATRPVPGTPPLIGARAPSFGRTPNWMTGPSSPRGSPGIPLPSRPALHRVDTPPSRSPPRQPVFGQPHAPDIHDHLRLTGTYCAPPAAPLSPPKETATSPPRGRQPALNAVVGGQYATAEKKDFAKGHARRRSWNGDMGTMSGDWEETAEDPGLDSPNTLAGVFGGASQTRAQNNLAVAVNTADLAKNGLSMAPRGGPAGVMDLFTPPRSLSPSPPRPEPVAPPTKSVPESPSTATTSPSITGNSPRDEFVALPTVIIDANDPTRENASTLQNASYQELIEKYCFFQSNASEVPSAIVPRQPLRPAYSSLSSPSSSSSVWGSDRLTPTGGRGYNPQNDNYFNFDPRSVYWGPEKQVDVTGWTPPSTGTTPTSLRYRSGSRSPVGERFISSRP